MAIKRASVTVYRRGGRRGIFYARIDQGTPFSLKTRSRVEAEAWRQEYLAGLRRQALGILGHFETARPSHSFDDGWTAYAQLPRFRAKSAATQANEMHRYNLFAEWCKAHDVQYLEQVTDAVILEYRRALTKDDRPRTGKPMQAISVNGYIRDAGYVWKYLCKERILAMANPFAGIEPLETQKACAKSRPWSEVQLVVTTAGLQNADIHLVFILGLYLGIRRSEILRARWEHVDWDNRTITLYRSKPRVSSYTVNMYPELIESLLPYRQPEGYIVKPTHQDASRAIRWDYRKPWDNVFKAVNANRPDPERIARFSSHQLRHTLITHLSAIGWPLSDIAAFVNQSEVYVTQHYAQAAPDLRRKTLKISVRSAV